MRGATSGILSNEEFEENFNPRSPCGERPVRQEKTGLKKGISIHAPRAGSDANQLTQNVRTNISIHAPRAGSDPGVPPAGNPPPPISIHAPRAGSDDINTIITNGVAADFNPRSPCGERLWSLFASSEFNA